MKPHLICLVEMMNVIKTMRFISPVNGIHECNLKLNTIEIIRLYSLQNYSFIIDCDEKKQY